MLGAEIEGDHSGDHNHYVVGSDGASECQHREYGYKDECDNSLDVDKFCEVFFDRVHISQPFTSLCDKTQGHLFYD